MAKRQFLQYEIYLTDRAAVDAANAAHPTGLFMAPETAATTYSAPIQEYTVGSFSAPCTRSSWFWSGFEANRPRDVLSFVRKSGGWFGIHALFGDTTVFYWVGTFYYMAPVAGEIEGEPVEAVNLATTSFLVGFERPPNGEGGDHRNASREASRHVDGFGMALRGDASTQSSDFFTNVYGAAARKASWERFYIRPRAVPTVASSCRLWSCRSSVSGLAGITITINTTNQLTVYNQDAGGTGTLLGTTEALEVGTWYKVDLLFSFATGGSGAGSKFYLYLNGVLKLTFLTLSGGLGENANHGRTILGPDGFAHSHEVDLDDWTCKTWPNTDSGGRFTGLDWLNGTKILSVGASGFGPGHGTYVGDFRTTLDSVYAGGSEVLGTGVSITSAVASDVAEIALDITTMNANPGSLGLVSMLVAQVSKGPNGGVLGYQVNGGTLTLSSITENTSSYTAFNKLYNPTPAPAPVPITSIILRYVKAASVSSSQILTMGAVVELVGVFGAEDVTVEDVGNPLPVPARNGIHNSPYPSSPWAHLGTRHQSPYIIHSGTYVGNGTGQDLVFRCPVNWIWIRAVGAGGFSMFRHTGMESNKVRFFQGIRTDAIVDMCIDPTFVGAGTEDAQEQRTLVRIATSEASANALGTTYQYVAVQDPGSRFMLNSSSKHPSALASAANALHDPRFLPLVAFITAESYSVDQSSTPYIVYKGQSHGALEWQSLTGSAPTNNTLSFTQGFVNTLPAAHQSAANGGMVGFNCWRKDDGSGDAGLPKVVQLGSYTGNGTASRTISFPIPAGVRPLWAIVQPRNAASIYRDPSHTGTTSTLCPSSNNASTGIIAGGIDSFDVGLVLNANGITYEFFVLPGSATAGNGGWSVNGEFAPVEPDSPPGYCEDPEASNFGEYGVCTYDPDPEPPVEDPDPDPGPDDGDDCEAGEVCVTATTKQVNLALLELGVNKLLTNYCTQETREAVIMQALYESCVKHTLVAYPWPFATKYATLGLTETQPTHSDWTYACRIPSDCVFPRRLVVNRGTAADPTPPPFGLSSDASGGILLTNQASPVLEYTCRPNCVAYNGDDLFLEALKWRLAAAAAPALTRVANEAERCMKMFEILIQKAEATIKPGVPGLRPSADPNDPDTTAAAIAANIQVINRGLIRIGAKTITNLTTEQSREAIAAKLVFEDELRSCLRDYPWSFATRYDEAPTLVGGTSTDPVNPDWQYSYRLPTDMVTVRRLVTEGTGRSFEAEPTTWRLGSDATGPLLFTGEDEPLVEYTARVDNAMVFADSVFRDALSWRIAASLAPTLAQVNPHAPDQHGRGPATPQDPTARQGRAYNESAQRKQVAQWAWAMYLQALRQAKVGDGNEQQQEPHGDAEWIRGRE